MRAALDLVASRKDQRRRQHNADVHLVIRDSTKGGRSDLNPIGWRRRDPRRSAERRKRRGGMDLAGWLTQGILLADLRGGVADDDAEMQVDRWSSAGMVWARGRARGVGEDVGLVVGVGGSAQEVSKVMTRAMRLCSMAWARMRGLGLISGDMLGSFYLVAGKN